mmetsp:Transcript_11650/g.26136  ORF Transcript_11650/g.26136 Transcript_11650/m.26136 type:complete len:254 (+) Transcript_11650:109-870(+)
MCVISRVSSKTGDPPCGYFGVKKKGKCKEKKGDPANESPSADGASIGDTRDVQVLRPLVLDMRGRECARAKRLLRLVARASARNAQHERRLVGCRGTARDAISRVPTSVNAFRRVHEVQLHALVCVARVAAHDHRPPRTRSRHARHVESLLPLFVNPLEGEVIRNLVALLRVRRALGHDYESVARIRSGKAGDVVPLLPLLHDPLFRKELLGQIPHLAGEARAGVHDERPQLLAAGHGGDEKAVLVSLVDVLL